MKQSPITAEVFETAAPGGTAGLSISDVMSQVLFTVSLDETVPLAWELLRRSGYRHLPVVDDTGACIGLLGATELAAAAGHAWPLEPQAVLTLLRDRETPTVPASATVQAAASLMARHHVDGLPVVDDDGLLVGLITAWDLVECLAGRRRLNEESSTGPVLFRIQPVLPAQERGK